MYLYTRTTRTMDVDALKILRQCNIKKKIQKKNVLIFIELTEIVAVKTQSYIMKFKGNKVITNPTITQLIEILKLYSSY